MNRRNFLVKTGHLGGIVSLSALRVKSGPADSGFVARQVSGELPRRPPSFISSW
jgi:hypothetical protein